MKNALYILQFAKYYITSQAMEVTPNSERIEAIVELC